MVDAAGPIVVTPAPVADGGLDAGTAFYGPNAPLRALIDPESSCARIVRVGYSKDGASFFWSDSMGETGPDRWSVEHTRTGHVAVHQFKPIGALSDDAYAKSEEAFGKEQTAFLDKNGIDEGEALVWTGPVWPYSDIVFHATRTEPPARPKVEFGARVDNEEPVPLHTFEFPKTGVYGIEGDGGWGYPPKSLVIAYSRLSPDGKELGILAQGCGYAFVTRSLSFRMPLAKLAADVYRQTALTLRKKGNAAKADALAAKAAALSPGAAGR